jgi:Tol biopolymer transport system component
MCVPSKQIKLFLLASLLFSALMSACGKVADTRIAFESDRDGSSAVYALNADSSEVTRLAGGGDPTWSPDKKRIAFMCEGICIMNADGSQQTKLPDIPPGAWEPTWSGDGRWIAFTSGYEIYKIKVDGSELTNLTNNPAADYHPAWSPDGKRIAFVSERDGKVAIYVMNADGTEPKRLTNTDFASIPAWSPDSKRLTYLSVNEGESGMFVMNADGTNQTLLMEDPQFSGDMAWSPDGTKIAFSSSRDGNLEIYVMNADGTGMTRLTDNPAHDRNPDW